MLVLSLRGIQGVYSTKGIQGVYSPYTWHSVVCIQVVYTGWLPTLCTFDFVTVTVLTKLMSHKHFANVHHSFIQIDESQ